MSMGLAGIASGVDTNSIVDQLMAIERNKITRQNLRTRSMLDEPGDWNMWRRIGAAGALVGHMAAPVTIHFREGSSMEGRPVSAPGRDAEDFVADVMATSARVLLGVGSASRGLLAQEPVAGV